MSKVNPMLCVCFGSIVLASCGGVVGLFDAVDINDIDFPAGEIHGFIPGLPSEDQSDEPVENPVIFPTTDAVSGGYVGSSAPLKDTITIPDLIVDYKLGYLRRTGSNPLDVRGVSFTFSEERTNSKYFSDYNRPLDSCHYTNKLDFSFRFPGFGESLSPPSPNEGLSAGEVLSLSGLGGSSIGEIHESMIRSLGYNLSSSVSTAALRASDTLSVRIPRDDFPSLDTVAFPSTPNLTGFAPQGGNFIDIESDFNPAEISTIVWDASNDPDAHIHLEFSADFPDTTDIFDISPSSVSFSCSLEDDKEFTFPQAVTELYERELRISRLHVAA